MCELWSMFFLSQQFFSFPWKRKLGKFCFPVESLTNFWHQKIEKKKNLLVVRLPWGRIIGISYSSLHCYFSYFAPVPCNWSCNGPIVHYHTCHDFWYPNHLGPLLFLSVGLLVVLPCHTNEGKKRILVFTQMLETRLGQCEPGTFHLVCLLMTIFNLGNVKFQLSNPNLVRGTISIY